MKFFSNVSNTNSQQKVVHPFIFLKLGYVCVQKADGLFFTMRGT